MQREAQKQQRQASPARFAKASAELCIQDCDLVLVPSTAIKPAGRAQAKVSSCWDAEKSFFNECGARCPCSLDAGSAFYSGIISLGLSQQSLASVQAGPAGLSHTT